MKRLEEEVAAEERVMETIEEGIKMKVKNRTIQSQTMLQGIGVALSHTPSSILSLDHLRVTVFIN